MPNVFKPIFCYLAHILKCGAKDDGKERKIQSERKDIMTKILQQDKLAFVLSLQLQKVLLYYFIYAHASEFAYSLSKLLTVD